MAWNKPSEKQANQKNGAAKAPSVAKGALCGLVVVVAAMAVGYFLLTGGKTSHKVESDKKAPKTIAEVTPAAAVTNRQAAKEQKAPVQAKEDGVPEMWQGQRVVKHTSVTNNTLVFEKFYTADGKVHGYYHDERAKALPTGADQILAIMTGADSGVGAPPLPHVKDFEKEFGRALKQEIVINDNDPPEVKEVKERVIAARQELVQLMSEGQSANDVLDNWRRMQEDNATVRLDAVRKVREMLDAGDRAGAKELCDSYNKILEKSGIMKIELPPEGGAHHRERKTNE